MTSATTVTMIAITGAFDRVAGSEGAGALRP
jgi:hypothetical protein